MSVQPLSNEQKGALASSLGSNYEVRWFETWPDRLRMAGLMFRNAKLRLTMPEAYRVHREVIEWESRFSQTGIPDMALGIDAVTAKLMRFVLGSWERVEFFNKYLAGTWLPRIQMDFIPSLACAAHFAMMAQRPPSTVDDFVAAGRAVQRFWLTATRLDLWQQPELTPLIFGSYARTGLRFTVSTKLQDMARELEVLSANIVGEDIDRVVWMGRLGFGPEPTARSVRRPLEELMYSPAAVERNFLS